MNIIPTVSFNPLSAVGVSSTASFGAVYSFQPDSFDMAGSDELIAHALGGNFVANPLPNDTSFRTQERTEYLVEVAPTAWLASLFADRHLDAAPLFADGLLPLGGNRVFASRKTAKMDAQDGAQGNAESDAKDNNVRTKASTFDFSEKRWPPNFLRGLRRRLSNRFRYKYLDYPSPISLRTALKHWVFDAYTYLFNPFSIKGMRIADVRAKQLNPIVFGEDGKFRTFDTFADTITAIESKYGKPWQFGEPTLESMKYGFGDNPAVSTPTLADRGDFYYGNIHHATDCLVRVRIDADGSVAIIIRSGQSFTSSGIPVENVWPESMRDSFRPMSSEFNVIYYFENGGKLSRVIIEKELYYWGMAPGQMFSTFNSKITTISKRFIVGMAK